MNNQTPRDLKEQFQNIEIPQDLEQRLAATMQKEIKSLRQKRIRQYIFRSVGVAAIALCAFAGSINLSPSFAQALSEAGLDNIVRVFTFSSYTHNDGYHDAQIDIPTVSALDGDVSHILNEKYLAEGSALYDEFMQEIAAMEEAGVEGHTGVDSSYQVLTNNDEVFSIVRYVVNTVGSSSTTQKHDTVDIKNQLIVTLPSLFVEDSDYVTVISENIKEQMRAQMAADENIIYMLDDPEMEEWNFTAIDANQDFYINSDGKLVICFDKYDVAPGYMGLVEFVIPTEVISDILLDRGLLH